MKNRSNTAEIEESLTRGHKKKARTKQTLIEAALRIYARESTTEFALNKLAKEAGMSQGTIYNYFKNPQEVRDAVAGNLAEKFSEDISQLSKNIDNGAQRVAIGMRMFMLRAQQEPEWAQATIQVFQSDRGMRSAVADNVRKDLQLGKKQKLFNYEDEETAMTLVSSATIGIMSSVVDGFAPPEYDRLMVKMVLMGLGMSPEGAAEIVQMELPDSMH